MSKQTKNFIKGFLTVFVIGLLWMTPFVVTSDYTIYSLPATLIFTFGGCVLCGFMGGVMGTFLTDIP